MRPLLAGLLALLLVPFPLASSAAARELKVATWNLDWLTERQAGDPALPGDVHPRAPRDFDLLRRYAALLDADVVAIEEVDGEAVAARLFPPDRYAVHLTADHVVQRVGIAVRHGIAFTANPDLTALDPDPEAPQPLRSGADITLHFPAGPLRLLAVHLKTGCWSKPLTARLRACEMLAGQLPVLERWIAARRHDGTPFLVLGDFNRDMKPGDAFLAALERTAPLVVPTTTRSDPCWGGNSDFIDHILAGGAARRWTEPGSLTVTVYRERDPAWKDRLSDHCPVSVLLNLPS